MVKEVVREWLAIGLCKLVLEVKEPLKVLHGLKLGPVGVLSAFRQLHGVGSDDCVDTRHGKDVFQDFKEVDREIRPATVQFINENEEWFWTSNVSADR